MSFIKGFANQIVADLTAREKADRLEAAEKRKEKREAKRLSQTAIQRQQNWQKAHDLNLKKFDLQKQEAKTKKIEKDRKIAYEKLKPFLQNALEGKPGGEISQIRTQILDAGVIGGEFSSPESMPSKMVTGREYKPHILALAKDAGMEVGDLNLYAQAREETQKQTSAKNMKELIGKYDFRPDFLDPKNPGVIELAKRVGKPVKKFISEYTYEYNKRNISKLTDQIPDNHTSMRSLFPNLTMSVINGNKPENAVLSLQPVRSVDGQRVLPVTFANLTPSSLTKNANPGISFLSFAEQLFQAGEGEKAMKNASFRSKLVDVVGFFKKNQIQHGPKGSRLLGLHVLKDLKGVNEALKNYTGPNKEEIQELAFESISSDDIRQNNPNSNIEQGWIDEKVIYDLAAAKDFNNYSKDNGHENLIKNLRKVDFRPSTESGKNDLKKFFSIVKDFSEGRRGTSSSQYELMQDATAIMIYNYKIQDQNHAIKKSDSIYLYTSDELKTRRQQQRGIRKGLTDINIALKLLAKSNKDVINSGIDKAARSTLLFANVADLISNFKTGVNIVKQGLGIHEKFLADVKDSDGKIIDPKKMNPNLKLSLQEYTNESLRRIEAHRKEMAGGVLTEDQYNTARQLELMKVKISYQMAGVFQGGTSGSRTISDQDFSIISSALWGGTGKEITVKLKRLKNTLTQGMMENEIALNLGIHTGLARNMENFVFDNYKNDINPYEGNRNVQEKETFNKVDNPIRLNSDENFRFSDFKKKITQDTSIRFYWRTGNNVGLGGSELSPISAKFDTDLTENEKKIRNTARQYTNKIINIANYAYKLFFDKNAPDFASEDYTQGEPRKKLENYFKKLEQEGPSLLPSIISEIINDDSLYLNLNIQSEGPASLPGVPKKGRFNPFKVGLFGTEDNPKNYFADSEKGILADHHNFTDINKNSIDFEEMIDAIVFLEDNNVLPGFQTVKLFGKNVPYWQVTTYILDKFNEENLPYWRK